MSSSEGSADAGEYDEWSDDGEDGQAQSLFSPEVLPDSAAAIAHDACSHDFDLAKFRLQARHAPPIPCLTWGVAEQTGYAPLSTATASPSPPFEMFGVAAPLFMPRMMLPQKRLDEYGVIRVVNYIRSEVAAGREPRGALSGEHQPWAGDKFLQPVLANDALLMHDFDEDEGALSAVADNAQPM